MVRPYSTQTVLEFVLQRLKIHRESAGSARPLIVGLSGPQGSGKSSVVKAVAAELRANPHKLNVVEYSLDDCYLTHADQVKVAQSGNSLIQHRGLPGTHDIQLCRDTMESLMRQEPTSVPQYDKSAFKGEGDRAPASEFLETTPPYDVVLFEGWCVGFTSLPDNEVERLWQNSTGPLKKHSLEHVKFVNNKLKEYSNIWDTFDAFVHLDSQSIQYVYQWRLQQEHAMIASGKAGMSDDGVRKFVDGYMPAYELYNHGLREFRGLGVKDAIRLQFDSNRRPIKKTKL